MDQDESDRVARLHTLAEQNFLRVRSGAGGALRITAGAHGRVVCAGDLAAVEQWLLRYNERIDAEVRRATRSQADLELEEMTREPATTDEAEPHGDQLGAMDGDSDVAATVVVQCAVITSQLAALTELLFRNPDALLGDGDDPMRSVEFGQFLRRSADTLDGLLPGR